MSSPSSKITNRSVIVSPGTTGEVVVSGFVEPAPIESPPVNG
jgi:hypothetical protein